MSRWLVRRISPFFWGLYTVLPTRTGKTERGKALADYQHSLDSSDGTALMS